MDNRYRILHIDDNPAFLRLFSLTFKSEFDIVSLNEPEKAIDVMRETPVDLVITDYMMQETTGLELLHQLKEHFPDVPVILFTGKGSETLAKEAFQLGVSDYFIKDVVAISYKERTTNTIKYIIEKAKSIVALRQSEKNLTDILNSINEAVIATDARDKITRMNRAAEQLCGWSSQEARGKNPGGIILLLDVKTGEQREEYLAPGEVTCPSLVASIPVLLRIRDGTDIPVLFKRCLTKDLDGSVTGSVLVLQDMRLEGVRDECLKVLEFARK